MLMNKFDDQQHHIIVVNLKKFINQYDGTVDDNDYVVATSIPPVFTASIGSMSPRLEQEKNMAIEMMNPEEEPMHEPFSKFDTSSW